MFDTGNYGCDFYHHNYRVFPTYTASKKPYASSMTLQSLLQYVVKHPEDSDGEENKITLDSFQFHPPLQNPLLDTVTCGAIPLESLEIDPIFRKKVSGGVVRGPLSLHPFSVQVQEGNLDPLKQSNLPDKFVLLEQVLEPGQLSTSHQLTISEQQLHSEQLCIPDQCLHQRQCQQQIFAQQEGEGSLFRPSPFAEPFVPLSSGIQTTSTSTPPLVGSLCQEATPSIIPSMERMPELPVQNVSAMQSFSDENFCGRLHHPPVGASWCSECGSSHLSSPFFVAYQSPQSVAHLNYCGAQSVASPPLSLLPMSPHNLLPNHAHHFISIIYHLLDKASHKPVAESEVELQKAKILCQYLMLPQQPRTVTQHSDPSPLGGGLSLDRQPGGGGSLFRLSPFAEPFVPLSSGIQTTPTSTPPLVASLCQEATPSIPQHQRISPPSITQHQQRSAQLQRMPLMPSVPSQGSTFPIQNSVQLSLQSISQSVPVSERMPELPIQNVSAMQSFGDENFGRRLHHPPVGASWCSECGSSHLSSPFFVAYQSPQSVAHLNYCGAQSVASPPLSLLPMSPHNLLPNHAHHFISIIYHLLDKASHKPVAESEVELQKAKILCQYLMLPQQPRTVTQHSDPSPLGGGLSLDRQPGLAPRQASKCCESIDSSDAIHVRPPSTYFASEIPNTEGEVKPNVEDESIHNELQTEKDELCSNALSGPAEDKQLHRDSDKKAPVGSQGSPTTGPVTEHTDLASKTPPIHDTSTSVEEAVIYSEEAVNKPSMGLFQEDVTNRTSPTCISLCAPQKDSFSRTAKPPVVYPKLTDQPVLQRCLSEPADAERNASKTGSSLLTQSLLSPPHQHPFLQSFCPPLSLSQLAAEQQSAKNLFPTFSSPPMRSRFRRQHPVSSPPGGFVHNYAPGSVYEAAYKVHLSTSSSVSDSSPVGINMQSSLPVSLAHGVCPFPNNGAPSPAAAAVSNGLRQTFTSTTRGDAQKSCASGAAIPSRLLVQPPHSSQLPSIVSLQSPSQPVFRVVKVKDLIPSSGLLGQRLEQTLPVGSPCVPSSVPLSSLNGSAPQGILPQGGTCKRVLTNNISQPTMQHSNRYEGLPSLSSSQAPPLPPCPRLSSALPPHPCLPAFYHQIKGRQPNRLPCPPPTHPDMIMNYTVQDYTSHQVPAPLHLNVQNYQASGLHIQPLQFNRSTNNNRENKPPTYNKRAKSIVIPSHKEFGIPGEELMKYFCAVLAAKGRDLELNLLCGPYYRDLLKCNRVCARGNELLSPSFFEQYSCFTVYGEPGH